MERGNFYKIFSLWLACICINIISFLVVYYKIHPAASSAALHYNFFVGVDWYGKSDSLYIPPIAALVITAINAFFYYAAEKRKNFLPFLVVFVTLVIQLTLLSAILFLAKVN